MLGAIIGDIAGSPYEFWMHNVPVDQRDLFPSEANYTDDTLMTLAVYDGLCRAGSDPKLGPQAVTESMQRIGQEFQPVGKGGFGRQFAQWLISSNPKPYGSCGNGSAMRVSSVGWLFPTLKETQLWAEITAIVTHNHPEGIRGAQATASAIFLARSGATKEQIKTYTEKEFGYHLSRPWAEVKTETPEGVTCQITVPQAFIAFLEAKTFEECIRLAIHLGGDTDTRAAIAGSIAEAYWGIPNESWRAAVWSRLPDPLTDLLDHFEQHRLAAIPSPQGSDSSAT